MLSLPLLTRKAARTGGGRVRRLLSSAPQKMAVVIGGSGFVGSHVVKNLVGKGYFVRATSRDAQRASWLKNLEDGTTGKVDVRSLELSTEAPDEKVMDDLVNGSQAIFFCAGFEKQDPSTIDFMVTNALAAVRAAKRQNVQCVVLTSSGGSTNPAGHPNSIPKDEVLHWSDPESQKAKGKFSPAAKTLMELQAFAEVGKNKENRVIDETKAAGSPRLCIMNPNLILGPQLHPGPISGNSLPWIVSILKGERMSEVIPNDSMSVIDVRDLAELHVAASENTGASGKYFCVERSHPWEDILTAFEVAYPGYKKPPKFEGDPAMPTQFNFTRRDSLKVPLRSLQDTVNDLIKFLEQKKAI